MLLEGGVRLSAEALARKHLPDELESLGTLDEITFPRRSRQLRETFPHSGAGQSPPAATLAVMTTPAHLEAMRDVAERAVQAGMDAVLDCRESEETASSDPPADTPANQSLTRADREVEAAIVAVLESADPVRPVVGEVSRGETATGEVWVVDPVDGTWNLVRGDSFVGVTAALLADGEPVVGAIGRPFTGELWSAARGLGAYDRSGARLAMKDTGDGKRRAVLDPAVSNERHLATWSAARRHLTATFDEVELRSAITLELAYVATGVLDALVQIGGSPVWDFAAGALLIREAGGVVRGLDGTERVWLTRVVLAGTPAVYAELLSALTGLLPTQRT